MVSLESRGAMYACQAEKRTVVEIAPSSSNRRSDGSMFASVAARTQAVRAENDGWSPRWMRSHEEDADGKLRGDTNTRVEKKKGTSAEREIARCV